MKHFGKIANIIVGNNQLALENIASNTESLGLKAVIISNSLTGEAREVGEAFAEKVKNLTIVFIVRKVWSGCSSEETLNNSHSITHIP